MAKLTLNRSTVVNVYELLGFPTAKTWNRDVLTKKAAKIKDLDLTAVEIKDGDLSAELDRIITVLTNEPDSEIEVLNDIVKEDASPAAESEAKSEPVKKTVKPAKEPKEPKEKKYPKGFHKGRETAGFHAGAILKKFGLAGGITEEMVIAYDKAREKDKPREAKNALAWAAHVLNGFNAIPDESPSEEPPAPTAEAAADGLEEYDNEPETANA